MPNPPNPVPVPKADVDVVTVDVPKPKLPPKPVEVVVGAALNPPKDVDPNAGAELTAPKAGADVAGAPKALVDAPAKPKLVNAMKIWKITNDQAISNIFKKLTFRRCTCCKSTSITEIKRHYYCFRNPTPNFCYILCMIII